MKSKWKAIGILLIAILVIFKIWSAYPVQDFVVRLVPIAHDFFDPYVARMPSWLLVEYLGDGNFYLAESAKVALGSRGVSAKKYFDKVMRMTGDSKGDVRARAYSVLQSLDKERAVNFYFEELDRLSSTSSEYRQCLGILHNYRLPQLLPYLIEYANRFDGWKNASCVYLEEYGNPEALPVLYEQRKKAEAESLRGVRQAKYELKRINKAISALEAIKASQEKSS